MGFEVRIGVNPIGWSNDDLPALGGETPLETALAEGREIGFEGSELGNKFPREPRALADKLGQFDLACVSGWYSGRLARRGVAEEIEAAADHVRLLAANGSGVMVYGEVADSIQGAPVALHKRPRFFRDADWEAYGRRLTEFARHTLSQGVRLAYHHHMGAYVESAEDIDRLMAVTGPEVGLLFDSGHVTFGGGDPLAVLERHVGRVCHVHAKDVRAGVMRLARNRRWSFLEAVVNGVFAVPGDGCVDFPGIVAQLRAHGYRGWIVLEAEQDPAVAPSCDHARRGYRHLRALVDRA
jgi:inosose dehydratase